MDRFEKGLVGLVVVLFALAGFWFNSLMKMQALAIPVEVTSDAATTPILGTMQKNTMEISSNTGTKIPASIKTAQTADTTAEKTENKLWAAIKTGFASAFRSATQMFVKQIAKDTATWVASGGKGQRPLFITEGWGAYIQNVGDSALGIFVEDFIKNSHLPINFMSDVCKPNFNVRLGIILGIKTEELPKANCKFSEMMNNWSSAINDASFGFEYKVYLQRENDIKLYLDTQSSLSTYVNKQVSAAQNDINSAGGWLGIKNYRDAILTPGTVVRDKFTEATKDTTLSSAGQQFTNTVWDFVETFLNTLVSAFLQRLQTGFFSDSTETYTSNTYNTVDSLYGYNSSAISGGKDAAGQTFGNVFRADTKVGSVYDILSKLMVCTDAQKTNPGPTDCVIDSILADAISRRSLVNDLPESIKNRPFAPKINEITNPQTAFTLRNIIILRKYRIVPVGWEIAARYLDSLKESKSYTLGDLINLFEADKDGLSPQEGFLVGLVDPYWVLKAPELFCRREGYGPDLTNDQGGNINRETYCADEQQCIKEDATGNCLAFGYCTEEKRVWDISSQTCEPQFNTCQTFRMKDNTVASYLTNTLDYRNCNSGNAGCRWYSGLFNAVSNDWRHITPTTAVSVCTGGACPVSASATIPQWQQQAGNVLMDKPCAKDGGCNFAGASCTIPKGGIKCRVDLCASADLLVSLNGNFDKAGSCLASKTYDALNWNEGWTNIDNGHSCAPGEGQQGNALKAYSLNNAAEIVSSLDVGGLDTNKNYDLTFYVKGRINVGGIKIQARSGGLTGSVLAEKEINTGEVIDNWTSYSIAFNTQTQNKIALAVVTMPDTSGTVLFDNFELRSKRENCSDEPIWIFNSAPSAVSATEAGQDIYFDAGAEKCASDSAGCNQFIRTKAGLGSNLVVDGSFEGESVDASIKDAKAHSGSSAAKLSSDTPITLDVVGGLMANHKYILSGYAYSTLGSVDAYFDILGDPTKKVNVTNFAISNDWNRFYLAFISTANVPSLKIEIKNNDGAKAVWFDDIKLEEVNYNDTAGTVYTPYEPSQRPENQLTYLKKAPNYFNCYRKADGTWPATTTELNAVLSGRDSACSNYAPVCIRSEVGCELYTPTSGDPVVSGTITSNDLCPGECVGYQPYRQSKTNFVSAKNVAFIANTKPKYCSAGYAGCDEFTNIDTVTAGGEGLEYYVNLRVCQKPTSLDNGSFVTWEGDGTTGYALKDYRLKKSNGWKDASHSGIVDAPCVNLKYNTDGSNYCADDTMINPANGSAVALAMSASGYISLNGYLGFLSSSPVNADDPGSIKDPLQLNKNVVDELHTFGVCAKQEIRGYYYFNDKGDQDSTNDEFIYIPANPDCTEFYGTSGEVNYRLLSRVVYVDDNCHPYRRTQTQAPDQVEKDCNENGGYWNTNKECVYMAIPNQGVTCSAEFKGCREYVGNRGNNLRNVIYDEFENKSVSGWQGGTLNSEALFVGGNSLSGSGSGANGDPTFKKPVLVGQNKTYLLSFWAKGNSDFNIDSIKFAGTPADKDVFAKADRVVAIKGSWMKYDLGPVFVDWLNNNQTLNLEITVPSGQTIYLDNILLKEVKDNVYLVENSWFTPFSCDNKLDNPTGASCDSKRCDSGEMLGCSAYNNSANERFNLKSFSSLCRLEAVGCEAMIDTYNSESDKAQNFNEGADEGTVDVDKITVPADEMVYMVNNAKYNCPKVDKGCTAFGLPDVNNQDVAVGYSTAYIKNQPDNYGVSLCTSNAVWCDEYTGGRSTVWFKNPRNKICEYRVNAVTGAYDWLKNGTNVSCDTSGLQTIGYGAKAEKTQPVGYYQAVSGTVRTDYAGWVGSCSVAQNGCTEYIDPYTDIYPNLIKNGGFEDDFDKNNVPDDWTAVVGYDANKYVTKATQDIKTDADTLYTVSAKVNSGTGAVEVSCNANWIKIDNSNKGKTANQICKNAGFSKATEGKRCANRPVNTTEFYTFTDELFCNGTKPYQDCFNLAPCGNLSSEVSGWDSIFCDGEGIYSPDNTSVIVPASGSSLEKITISGSGNISGRFYTGGQFACSLSVTGSGGIDDVKLVKSGVYYVSGSVDRTSCAGQVDAKNGCVLFNDRSSIGYNMDYNANNLLSQANKYLTFDVDKTATQKQPTSPAAGVDRQKNADVVIKVAPNRKCSTWLSCVSYEKDSLNANNSFSRQDKCLDVGLCSSIDNNGNCNQFVTNASSGADYYTEADVNKTGYAKIGKYLGVNEVVSGYYPFENMNQSGSMTLVSNGNFEAFNESGYPLGWVDLNDKSWTAGAFKVISDPKTTRQEGINYPTDSRTFLKFSPSLGSPASEVVEVEPNSEYFFNAEINTVHLKSQNNDNKIYAMVDLVVYDTTGKEIFTDDISSCSGESLPFKLPDGLSDRSFNRTCSIIYNVGAGQGWKNYSGRFKTGEKAAKIKVALRAYYNVNDSLISTCDASRAGNDNVQLARNACSGSVYVDNIQIRPVLESKPNDKPNSTVPQSCRAYPESSSLSCDYTSSEGNYYRGWYGYCLERDIYPGSNDTCLMWYPVDKILGDGITEWNGYSGNKPAYYITATGSIEKTLRLNMDFHNDNDQNQIFNSDGSGGLWADAGSGDCAQNPRMDGFAYLVDKNATRGLVADGFERCLEKGNIVEMIYTKSAGFEPKSFGENYSSDGKLSAVCTLGLDGDPGHEPSYTGTVDIKCRLPYASEIVRTVTVSGQNKYWSGRTFEGSNFSFPCYMKGIETPLCQYNAITPPFGSVSGSVLSTNNPVDWDGDPNITGKQPVYYGIGEGILGYNSLASHTRDNLQKIFAMSYGTWLWSMADNAYKPSNGQEWTVPTTICAGVRPDYNSNNLQADWCAIRPRIVNVKVNDQASGKVEINDNMYVSVKFNTIVDSQQLPLVMYVIDFGDGEPIAVTGVQMEQRPNETEAHSMYHAYSYIDLKQKSLSKDSGIICGLDCYGDRDGVGNRFCISESDNVPYCAVQPKLKAKDNWGWCTGDGNHDGKNPVCSQWYIPSNLYIVVKQEKL